MGCADTFQPLLDQLSQLDPDRHIIALDLPGAGQSERRENIDASLLTTANLVARFTQQLGLHKPIVLGHSHGGAVAMSLAAKHRDLLHSIVLLSPAHPWFDEGDPVIRFYLTLPGRLFAYSMPWFPIWAQLICLRRMAGRRSCDTVQHLRPYRENLRTPGTMIDRAVPVASASALREHLGHSELLVLPGIGHRPAEEVPDLVAAFLHQWIEADLASVPAPVAEPASIRYSPNAAPSQPLIAALMTSSFEAGD
jgi:pimeloyl-ACP methyl ester carboxylesterase